MKNDVNLITRQMLRASSFDEITAGEIEQFIERYPYVAPARLLLARKKQATDPSPVNEETITASLYFHNPLWLYHQLNDASVAEVEGGEPEKTAAPGETDEPVAQETTQQEESPIVFQSYHTIDYFASQGIRLQQADLGRDKLGQQLKSFTEWLRSMKKLPTAENELPAGTEDSGQQVVIINAASSIEEKEVVTEAMAEVWAKQGNRQKAMEIYQKLSLQNPAKSAYFAAKIDQIK